MLAPNIGARTEAISLRTGPWQLVPWVPVQLPITRKTRLFRGFLPGPNAGTGQRVSKTNFRKILTGSIPSSDYYILGGITEFNFSIRTENPRQARRREASMC